MSYLNTLLKENYNQNKEIAKTLRPKYKKGDKARVLKNLTVNITDLKEYLGEVCIVEDVRLLMGVFNQPKYEYQLKLNNRIEPFFEDELDSRYGRKIKRND